MMKLKGSTVMAIKQFKRFHSDGTKFKRFHSDGTKNNLKGSIVMALKTVEKVPQ